METKGKTNLVFAVLAAYVLIQFLWWAYLLLSLNTDYYLMKSELYLAWGVQPDIAPSEELSRKRWMIAGEGAIFLLLLIVGILLSARYMKRDIRLVRLQRNFLLSVTHELKTPIASTKLYLQTLQKRQLDQEKKTEILTRALRGNQRLESLVEKIILATQLEQSHFEPELARVPLLPVVENAIEVLKTLDSDKHRFKLDIDAGIVVYADPVALDTMWMNLLENAVKYSPSGSEIVVSAEKRDEHVLFRVANEGYIAPSDEKQVFTKFFRVGNEETRTTRGTGVGLFLVRELAAIHGGKVSLKVAEGKVIFTLQLPARP